jgi:AP-3 complex subunit sigma
VCNFLDAPELVFPSPGSVVNGSAKTTPAAARNSDDDTRVIYRHYATLYFVFVVDGAESELGVLDLIQVFVESLDRTFENVCELDLIFHFDEVSSSGHAPADIQVQYALNEIIQGGMVLETNIGEIGQCSELCLVESSNSQYKQSSGIARRRPRVPTRCFLLCWSPLALGRVPAAVAVV